ncbi:MAG TPA: DUF456 domain-containing protein [Flavobacteriaceae bacterium]|nr:DUF456 domain-containing protein [Flavobacteriaceae bacterium]
MEIVILLLGMILCVVGIMGSFLPVLPGLPISWLGLLLFYFIPGIEMDYWFLGITLAVTILLFVLDYVIPAQGTKRFGGSRAGAIGTTIGLIVGLFFPFGILIGPFLGALIGELVFNKTNSKTAFKAAFGSFIGFLAGTFINFMASVVFLGLYIWKVWENQTIIF